MINLTILETGTARGGFHQYACQKQLLIEKQREK